MSSYQSDRPNVVATITQKQDLEILTGETELELPDVLEFRLDNLVDHIDSTREAASGLPAGVAKLITARHPAEGGIGDLNENRRLELYREFLESSDLLDTEVLSLQKSGFRELVPEARQAGTTVIASFHDFEKSPPRSLLEDTIASAYQSGADIAKLAVVVTTFAELNTLVELVEANTQAGKAISAMGMGPLGKLSRLVLAKAGSCLNYGYFRVENAPGQWSAAELAGLIGEI